MFYIYDIRPLFQIMDERTGPNNCTGPKWYGGPKFRSDIYLVRSVVRWWMVQSVVRNFGPEFRSEVEGSGSGQKFWSVFSVPVQDGPVRSDFSIFIDIFWCHHWPDFKNSVHYKRIMELDQMRHSLAWLTTCSTTITDRKCWWCIIVGYGFRCNARQPKWPMIKSSWATRWTLMKPRRIKLGRKLPRPFANPKNDAASRRKHRFIIALVFVPLFNPWLIFIFEFSLCHVKCSIITKLLFI